MCDGVAESFVIQISCWVNRGALKHLIHLYNNRKRKSLIKELEQDKPKDHCEVILQSLKLETVDACLLKIPARLKKAYISFTEVTKLEASTSGFSMKAFTQLNCHSSGHKVTSAKETY